MEEVTKNDKVKEILEKLLVTEKYKGKHLKSTFKPERHDNIDEEKKRKKTKIKKTTHAESKDDKTKSIVQKISEYCNQKDRLIKGEVEELIKKILEDYSLKKVDNSDLECLLPINDFNDFIDIIDNESNTNLIEIIKNKSFEYISGKRNEHAEVKIANWLLEIGIMGDYYIGISKLTCSPCHVTIGLINK